MATTKPTVGSLPRHNINSPLNSHSHAPPVEAATRELIQSDLENRFHQDIDMLLLLDMPSDCDAAWSSRVDSIEAAFSRNPEMRHKIDVLQDIVAKQEGQERERERSMYGPLCDILNWIVENDRQDETLEFTRQWLIGAHAGPWMETEPGKDANNRKPDLVLVERAPERRLEPGYRPFWRQVSATVAVKTDPEDGPNKSTVLVAAVVQTLDQMRVHLAFRPFQRWTFGLLVCGMDFYVLYLDRAGGFITPTQNLISDSRLFIKIVLHMAKVMSRSQLGQDPEVKFGLKSRVQMREGPGPQTYPWDREFPVYTFPAFSGSGQISTNGKPVFVAYGILGRGTSVWKVHSDDQATGHIMKYSYRNVKRKSESAVYAAIQTVLPSIAGICKFVDGDDLPWDMKFQRTTIPELLKHGEPTINPRRKLLSYALPPVYDRVVHRLRLSSCGESLSSFENIRHLTQVLTSALDAHAALVANGILHRDISAGNILILNEEGKKEENKQPPHGLLADIELAKILPQHDPRLSSLLPGSDEDITRPDFTCTPHFASSELLAAIRHQNRSNFTASVKHDLQGFFWVTIWALLIKCETYERATFVNATAQALQRWTKSHKARRHLLTGLFGPHQIAAIHDFRVVIFFPQNWPPESIFPKGLHEEIDNSRILWSRMTSAFESVVLKDFDITHKDVRSALDLDNVTCS